MKSFLNQVERDALKIQHRAEKNGRIRDRIKAVLLADKGWTHKAIAEALLLDEETISVHIREYVDHKKLTMEYSGTLGKLNSEQSVELTNHLIVSSYVKSQEICEYVKTTYNVVYTVSGMTSWLKNNGFAYKKQKGVPLKADKEKQTAFIQTYNELLETVAQDEPILFADGVHPSMATKIAYGWIKKGTDKVIGTTASRTRLNLFGALCLSSMKLIIRDYQTINSDALELFFIELASNYPLATKIHLIVDQGPYNKSKQTQEAAKKHNIIIHYLPPYSPNLNPIERLWKITNEQVRNNICFKSAPEFRKSILNFFSITWPKIAQSMRSRINDNFQQLQSVV